MRDTEYNKFHNNVLTIFKDCMVTEQVAKTNKKQYTIHEMILPINKGRKICYDKEKAKKYKEDLIAIFKQIPRSGLKRCRRLNFYRKIGCGKCSS